MGLERRGRRTFASVGVALRRPGCRHHARGDLRPLSREECLLLLGREALGRVSVSIGALPLILPVNYSLFDGAIVLRTAQGTKLGAALAGTVVGFEIDGTDTGHTTGWSVLVIGHAREIRHESALERV